VATLSTLISSITYLDEFNLITCMVLLEGCVLKTLHLILHFCSSILQCGTNNSLLGTGVEDSIQYLPQPL